LPGIDDVHNEALYVASNIPIFFLKMLNLFVTSIKISPSVAGKRFLDSERGRKYKI